MSGSICWRGGSLSAIARSLSVVVLQQQSLEHHLAIADFRRSCDERLSEVIAEAVGVEVGSFEHAFSRFGIECPQNDISIARQAASNPHRLFYRARIKRDIRKNKGCCLARAQHRNDKLTKFDIAFRLDKCLAFWRSGCAFFFGYRRDGGSRIEALKRIISRRIS